MEHRNMWVRANENCQILRHAAVSFFLISTTFPRRLPCTWPSYPNNSAISVTSGGNVGIGTGMISHSMDFVITPLMTPRRSDIRMPGAAMLLQPVLNHLGA